MKLNLLIFPLVVVSLIKFSAAQHENIPYAAIGNICQKCSCLTANQYEKLFFILDCHEQGLKHILPIWPEEFGKNHSGIEIHVTFSDNQIPLLQQLPLTQGILQFSCRNCQINDIQAPTFIDSPNIIRLDLSYNQLKADALNPDIFRGPYNETAYEPIGLEELDLNYNQINSLDIRLFEHTPNLKRLHLAGNKFIDINIGTMDAISSAVNLELLNLAYNSLKSLPTEMFDHLRKLHTVYLQGNHFKQFPGELKEASKSLQILDISANLISNLEVSSFDEFYELKFLNLSEMNTLTSVEDGTFSSLYNLEQLICRNNLNLTKFHLPTSSKNLKKLDISNCNIKYIILDVDILHSSTNESLNYWPKMINLHLSGNPWNCDCGLMKIFHQFSNIITIQDETVRCSSPYNLAGRNLQSINDDVCAQVNAIQVENSSSEFNTPYFLRPKSITVTVIILGFAISVGIITGFGIVLIRLRLKKNIFVISSGEIRYTSVRNV